MKTIDVPKSNAKYDLKGSIAKRTTYDTSNTITKKDNNLRGKLFVTRKYKKLSSLLYILSRDTMFLRNMDIIDYSLFVVVYSKHVKSLYKDNFISGKFLISNKYVYNCSVSFNIIDILQKTTVKKKLEAILKGKNASVKGRTEYRNRFMQFAQSHFIPYVKTIQPSCKYSAKSVFIL